MGTSKSSEYTVMAVISVTKISTSAPLEKIGILRCGICTGYGAVSTPKKLNIFNQL